MAMRHKLVVMCAVRNSYIEFELSVTFTYQQHTFVTLPKVLKLLTVLLHRHKY